MADSFVASMTALGTYRDRSICVTEVTGGGHRFHGYRSMKFSQLQSILKTYQKNAVFRPNSSGVLTVELRGMTSHNTCTGVVDPSLLEEPPYSLRPVYPVINTGAVSKHTYVSSDAVTDTLLHQLFAHPFVLDVHVCAGLISVFVVHDRNIHGGLLQHIQRIGKTSCKLRTRSTACKSTHRRPPATTPRA